MSIPNNTTIEIQLEFENPLAISFQSQADRIKISFEDESFFLDPQNGVPLAKLESIKSIPSQMPYDCSGCDTFVETAVSVQKGVVVGTAASPERPKGKNFLWA